MESRFACVTAPRRFGKTVNLKILKAFLQPDNGLITSTVTDCCSVFINHDLSKFLLLIKRDKVAIIETAKAKASCVILKHKLNHIKSSTVAVNYCNCVYFLNYTTAVCKWVTPPQVTSGTRSPPASSSNILLWVFC